MKIEYFIDSKINESEQYLVHKTICKKLDEKGGDAYSLGVFYNPQDAVIHAQERFEALKQQIISCESCCAST